MSNYIYICIYMCVCMCIYILTLYILILIVLWHRELISNRKETSCPPLLNAVFEPWKSETPNRQHIYIYIYGIYIYADLNYHPYPKILLMFTSLNLMLPTTGMCYQLYISDHFYYTSTVPHITTQYAYRYSVIEWGALKYYLNISNN